MRSHAHRRWNFTAVLAVTVFAGVTVPLASAPHASAYTLLAPGQGGAVWYQDYAGVPCGPNGATVVWNPCELEIVYDSSVTGRFEWAASVDAGAIEWDIWDNSRNRQDWYYRSNDVNYQNATTIYASDLGGPNSSGAIILGQANVSYLCFLNPCYMDYADTTLTTNGAVTWCLVDGENCGNPAAVYMQDVASHELGHDLGLDHPTVGPSSSGPIMQCFEPSDTFVGVRTDDINGVFHDYSGHPNDFPSPGSSPC